MGSRLSKTWVVAATITALLVTAGWEPGTFAQKDGAPLWYSVATVKRVEKPNRVRTRPVPKTGKQQAAPLTLQWRLLERADNNVQREADPGQVFRNDDQLKLAVTTNQDGYLYVIHSMNNGDGRLVFPDPRSNGGRNEVKKNQEYIVPSYCPSYPDPNDCWWTMAPPTGRENFIVVFSRDLFEKLPKQATLDNDEYDYPIVARDLIEGLINTSRQKVRQATGRLTIPGKQTARFATRLQNTNLEDNEELIARIQLKHGD